MALGRGRSGGGAATVAKVVGEEHRLAERRSPFDDLRADVLEEGGRAPSTEQHDVGRRVAG